MIPAFVIQQLGEEKAQLRLKAEEDYFLVGQPRTGGFAERALKKLSLWDWARHNAWDIRFFENSLIIEKLPDELDGLRILHLSDFHLGFDSRGLNPRIEKLKELEYDLVLFTGDLIDRNGDRLRAWEEWSRIRSLIDKPIYAVPGNHDSMEVLERLYKEGIHWLLNDSLQVEYSGFEFFLCGVDDSHRFKTHDLDRAFEKVPKDAFSLFLSHVPSQAKEVLGRAKIQLSGHTHGGQVCMPLGLPFYRNGDTSLRMMAGNWTYEKLRGYTSRGIGSSGVSARAFCPPEIPIHCLQQKS